MEPKAFLFLSLLFSIAPLISSVGVADTSQVDGVKEINQQDNSKDCKWLGGSTMASDQKLDESKEPNQQWGGGKRCRWQCGCCPRSPKGYGCLQCCHYVADATAVESHKGGARGSRKRGSGGGWGGGNGGGGHNGGRGGGGGGGGGSGWGGGHGGSQGGGKGGDGDHHGGGKGGDSGSQQGGGGHKGGGGSGGVGGDKGRRTLKMFVTGEGKVAALTLKKLKAMGKNKISV